MAFLSLPKTLHRLIAYLQPPPLGSSRYEQHYIYERVSNRKHRFQTALTAAECKICIDQLKSKKKKGGGRFGTNSHSLPPSRVCYFHSALTWQKSQKHNGSENVTFTCHKTIPGVWAPLLSPLSTSLVPLLDSLLQPELNSCLQAGHAFTPPRFCSKCLLCLTCLPSSLPGKHFITQCHLSWKDRWINPLIQDYPLPNT